VNTLLLGPVLYAIFLLDMKLIRWEAKPAAALAASVQVSTLA
jgi:hypothetical protein